MFLENLKIIKGDGEVVRDISFQKGINFIVDETPEDESPQITGNNVGKTTVLRLVDYCLGADGKNIYQDSEFRKHSNTTIKNYLTEQEVIVLISLVDDLDDIINRIIIKRNFLTHSKKIQEINGEKIIDNKAFQNKLKELIFKTTVREPRFRQIISKNIRDEKNKMNNIVRVLDPYVSNEVYEALFLFWLGINTDKLGEKQRLSDEKKKEGNFQKRLKKEGELSLIEQQLAFLNDKIEELEKKKNTFNLNENYSDDVETLNTVKFNLNKSSSELSRLEMRRNLIIESKEELEKEVSKIDTTQIALLYRKAKSLIPDIQTSFEDTVRFHNELISEKLDYITKELPELDQSIRRLKNQINSLRVKEDNLTEQLQKSGITEDFEIIITELNRQFERKGNLEEKKRLWVSSNEKLKMIESELDYLNKGILSKDKIIQSRIREFNKYFSEMSNRLYGEYYLLSSQSTSDKGYNLIVTNIEGNPSAGKKKGQIAAFDFAYIQFAQALNLPHLHFIMHDQIENIHDNQINTIVQVANSLNAQFIVPVLRDKIPEDIDIKQYEILSLSQDQKLFKID